MNGENNKEIIQIKSKLATNYEISEAIKVLRTNVVFSGEEKRAIGLTSCRSSEGKTTISMNLAAALAIDGKKTILLDTDMRKSVLAQFVGNVGHSEGLGQLLAGQCDLEDILYETDVPNLYIIFAGTRVANPTELLGSKRFQELVKTLKLSFSYVILDTPPLGMVIDCAIMAPVTDGLLIVVDTENNSYRAIRSVKQQYEKANGKIIGVVLNKCNLKDKSSYYGRAYGYGYGYGYGNEN